MLKYNQDFLKRYLKWGWLAFISITVIFAGITGYLAHVYPTAIHSMIKLLRAILPISGNNTQMFWGILLNNEKATLIILLLALIPIPGFYWLTFIMTSLSVGFVLGVRGAQSGWLLVVKAFVLGILPHGIFEMSALLLVVALAAQLNRGWRNFLFSRQLQQPISVKALLLQYLLIVVPLIALAALIEGFITPILLQWA